MSHTTKMTGQAVTEPELLQRAVEATPGAVWIGHKTGRHYDGRTSTGHWFKPAGWQKPACLTDAGELEFDNYDGAWGAESNMDDLFASYFTALVIDQAVLEGKPYTVEETEDHFLVTIG